MLLNLLHILWVIKWATCNHKGNKYGLEANNILVSELPLMFLALTKNLSMFFGIFFLIEDKFTIVLQQKSSWHLLYPGIIKLF